LKKALSERILNAELDEHLDEERGDGHANRRSHSKKTVLTGTSKMQSSIPRDRAGTFVPKLIARYQRHFPDFDADQIHVGVRTRADGVVAVPLTASQYAKMLLFRPQGGEGGR